MRHSRRFLLVAGLSAALSSAALAATASATVYTATQTTAIPPASSFSASAGGDGWDISLSNDRVFNVFHHAYETTVACHEQADASICAGYPKTVRDAQARDFRTSNQSGTYLDRRTGKLFIYAVRSDSTTGVVCFDTTVAATGDGFCGFTALSGAGEGEAGAVSGQMVAGNRLYAFNYVSSQAAGGTSGTGAQNRLLCFDLATESACAGQPYAVDVGAGSSGGSYGRNPAAIAGRIVIPVTMGGVDRLACFDTATQANCAGSWPAAAPSGYVGSNGSPFPLLSANGTATGICLPTTGAPCLALDGTSAATPSGMSTAITASSPYNGQAVTIGARVYVANGNENGYSGAVQCFDYSTSASCSGFPKTFTNLYYMYTVNRDPQRPTCLWVNADNGSGQIQSFDAFTGGACGRGATRVLTSAIVVPQERCYPTGYASIQVTDPAPGSYTGGTVQVADAGGNPIPGIATQTLDANGAVDLSALSIPASAGLPQFVIELTGAPTATQVTVKLSWNAVYDPTCVGPDTTAEAPAPPVAPGVAPTVALVPTNPALVDEGSTQTYRYTVVPGSAPVASAATDCGSAGVRTAETSDATGGTFSCRFPDGPAESIVRASATDTGGRTSNTDVQRVTIRNVAPLVVVDTAAAARALRAKLRTRTYPFTIVDPGQDSITAVRSSCGTGGKIVSETHTDTAGKLVCSYDHDLANPGVWVQASDSDGAAGNTSSVAKSLASVRAFTIHLYAPRRWPLRSARVWINGRRVPVRRNKARQLTAYVNLRGTICGAVDVRIIVRTFGGRLKRSSRRYLTCVPPRTTR